MLYVLWSLSRAALPPLPSVPAFGHMLFMYVHAIIQESAQLCLA